MLFLTLGIKAQATDSIKPMSPFKRAVGQYYFEAGMHVGQILQKKAGMYTHFSGNIIIYKKYHIGAQYERLTNYEQMSLFNQDTMLTKTYNFMHQSAGIKFGYIIFHSKKYQLEPNLSVNWAMIQYRTNALDIRKWNFCVIEPGITFNYIVHKNVSFGAGLHYRINLGLHNALQNKDLNGVYGNIFLRFGVLK